MKLHSITRRSDMLKCMLCHNAPCDTACPHGVAPEKILRHIWFNNEDYAATGLAKSNPCANCPAPCQQACLRPGEIPIRELITRLHEDGNVLKTDYDEKGTVLEVELPVTDAETYKQYEI